MEERTMNVLSGLSESYRVVGEMAESDGDSDMESFIIIPRYDEANSDYGSPPSSMNRSNSINGNSTSIMDRSNINVFELGQQAVRSAASSIPLQVDIPNSVAEECGTVAGPADDNELAPRTLIYSASQEAETGICHSGASMASNSTIASNISEASSLEEANLLLNDLSMENQKLKDLLTNKNEKMKKDLETYKSLQSTMIKMSVIDLEHKSKSEQWLSFIKNLREKNGKLQQDLLQKEKEMALFTSIAEQTKQDAKAEKIKLEALYASKEQEVDRLTRNVDSLNGILVKLKIETEELKESRQKQEVELMATNVSSFNLREENEKLKMELHSIEREFALHTSVERQFKQRIEIEELYASKDQEVDRLTRNVDSLNAILAKRNLETDELKESLQTREAELVAAKESAIKASDYHELQMERDMLNEAFEYSKTTIEQLNQSRIECKLESDQLMEALKARDDFIIQLQEEIQDLHVNCPKLAEDSMNMSQQKSFDIQRLKVVIEQMEQELIIRGNEITNARKVLTQVNESLTQKDEEIAVLQTRLALFRTQEEEKECYKTQMEEYKFNFEAERKDCLSLAMQKNQLTEEVEHLKADLVNKTTELENLYAQLELATEHMERKGSGSQGSPVSQNEASASASAAPKPKHHCPLCNRKFSTTDALITHASNCGEREPFVFP